MKLKPILAACAFAVASFGASAALTITPFDSSGNAVFSNQTAGSPSFADSVTFSVPDYADLTTGTLTTTFIEGKQDVDITSVVITGGSGPYSFVQALSDPFETWQLSGVTLFANVVYTLTVNGIQSLSSPGGYSGLLSVTPVPEPETYALMLAGLGLMGFIARRRRPQQ